MEHSSPRPRRQGAGSREAGVGPLLAAPSVPPELWLAGDVSNALASRHMGHVIRAYRNHPFHQRPGLSQETVGAWVGITQAQLSRIENGPPIVHLDRLIQWARVLRIPPEHLWFKLPERQDKPEPVDHGEAPYLAWTRGPGGAEQGPTRAPARRLRLRQLVEWVADAAAASPEAIEQALRARLEHLREPGPDSLDERRYRRARVPHPAVVDTLIGYYGEEKLRAFGLEPFRFESEAQPVHTCVTTRTGWTGCRVELGGRQEHCALLAPHVTPAVSPFRTDLLDAGIERLAEAEAGGQKLWDADIYRLVDVDLSAGRLEASFALDRFAHYAMTLDLLENELLDALAAHGHDPTRVLSDPASTLPLRTAYLPDAATLCRWQTRLCAGGMGTLFAYAVDRSRYRVILQRRSRKVLNGVGRLSVVPKGFHQPTWDPCEEAALGATVERELEEELMGRNELESGERLTVVDPYEGEARTPQMQWLLCHPEAWFRECTGLSLNLLTGNYDFGCVVAVLDPAFGRLRSNWEMEVTIPVTAGAADRVGLRQWARADGWVDEALFAFVGGVQRLEELFDRSPGRS